MKGEVRLPKEDVHQLSELYQQPIKRKDQKTSRRCRLLPESESVSGSRARNRSGGRSELMMACWGLRNRPDLRGQSTVH